MTQRPLAPLRPKTCLGRGHVLVHLFNPFLAMLTMGLTLLTDYPHCYAWPSLLSLLSLVPHYEPHYLATSLSLATLATCIYLRVYSHNLATLATYLMYLPSSLPH